MSHIDYDGRGELHITNITEAVQMDKSEIDRVITVCQEPIDDNVSSDTEYSWYDMSDGDPVVEGQYGGSCEYSLFSDAANELYTALSDGETVLIHCHAGQSRSVSVSAAALGRLLDIGRADTLDTIHHYRITHAYPDQKLMDHARTYINQYTDVCQRPFQKDN